MKHLVPMSLFLESLNRTENRPRMEEVLRTTPLTYWWSLDLAAALPDLFSWESRSRGWDADRFGGAYGEVKFELHVWRIDLDPREFRLRDLGLKSDRELGIDPDTIDWALPAFYDKTVVLPSFDREPVKVLLLYSGIEDGPNWYQQYKRIQYLPALAGVPEIGREPILDLVRTELLDPIGLRSTVPEWWDQD